MWLLSADQDGEKGSYETRFLNVYEEDKLQKFRNKVTTLTQQI